MALSIAASARWREVLRLNREARERLRATFRALSADKLTKGEAQLRALRLKA